MIANNPQWQLLDGHLVREIRTRNYQGAASIVQGQVALAKRLDHHARVVLEYRSMRVEVWTHDRNGITSLDLDFAREFDDLLEGFVEVLS